MHDNMSNHLYRLNGTDIPKSCVLARKKSSEGVETYYMQGCLGKLENHCHSVVHILSQRKPFVPLCPLFSTHVAKSIQTGIYVSTIN